MRILKYLSASLLLSFFISCEKENSPSLLLLEPADMEIAMKSGEIQQFKINCSSNTVLKSLKITCKEGNTFTKVIVDTALTTVKFKMTFEYRAPSVIDTRTDILTFSLTDAKGNQTDLQRFIIISPVNVMLKEKTGNVMYSHLSGKFDAFDLERAEPIYSSQHDLWKIHIKDNSIDSINHNTLSRKWISMTGLKFVRFNDFDYANASYLSVRKAYEVGLKNPILDNIKVEDIVLTKLNNLNPDSGFMAIRIVYVIDADSTLTDRYQFDIKK